jgi:hypothetical protein
VSGKVTHCVCGTVRKCEVSDSLVVVLSAECYINSLLPFLPSFLLFVSELCRHKSLSLLL